MSDNFDPEEELNIRQQEEYPSDDYLFEEWNRNRIQNPQNGSELDQNCNFEELDLIPENNMRPSVSEYIQNPNMYSSEDYSLLSEEQEFLQNIPNDSHYYNGLPNTLQSNDGSNYPTDWFQMNSSYPSFDGNKPIMRTDSDENTSESIQFQKFRKSLKLNQNSNEMIEIDSTNNWSELTKANNQSFPTNANRVRLVKNVNTESGKSGNYPVFSRYPTDYRKRFNIYDKRTDSTHSSAQSLVNSQNSFLQNTDYSSSESSPLPSDVIDLEFSSDSSFSNYLAKNNKFVYSSEDWSESTPDLNQSEVDESETHQKLSPSLRSGLSLSSTTLKNNDKSTPVSCDSVESQETKDSDSDSNSSQDFVETFSTDLSKSSEVVIKKIEENEESDDLFSTSSNLSVISAKSADSEDNQNKKINESVEEEKGKAKSKESEAKRSDLALLKSPEMGPNI